MAPTCAVPVRSMGLGLADWMHRRSHDYACPMGLPTRLSWVSTVIPNLVWDHDEDPSDSVAGWLPARASIYI